MLLPAVVQMIVFNWPVTPAASVTVTVPPDESTVEIAVETETAVEVLVSASELLVATNVGM